MLFASVISCLSWDGISDLHWSARALFHSSIILALVSVVSGAQQQWTLPAEDSLKAGNIELGRIKNLLENHKKGLVFALQCPLMFFAYSVALFLSGVYAVIFSPLVRHGSWGDDTKVRSDHSLIEKSQALKRSIDSHALQCCEHFRDHGILCLHSLHLRDSAIIVNMLQKPT